MKRILLFVFLSGCISLWASPRLQKKIHLPETIYAVPGIECNIYFENIFLTINASNFAFEVKCKKGSCEKKRWRFTPGKTDTGTYDLQLNVYDDQGLAATASTKLKIVPADAGKGKNISLLLIGSSELERYHAFPIHIYRLFQQDGNPTLKMLGENGPGWPDQIKEVRHEGYGGWSYRNFTTYGRSFVKGRSNQRGNPFWDPRKKALDFKTYFKKHNGNKAPDFVLISLGGNDIFLSTDKTLAGDLAAIRKGSHFFFPHSAKPLRIQRSRWQNWNTVPIHRMPSEGITSVCRTAGK